jgi:quinoprotein glucose dehydrogenase
MRKLTRRKMLAASSASLLAAQTGAWAQGRGGGRGAGNANPGAVAAGVPDTEWHGYANDNACTRYAPLDQISASNFSKLEVGWRFRTDLLGAGPETNNECTPVLANGRLFLSGGVRRDVVALDAGTGEMLWMYRTDEGPRRGSRTGSGRGVTYWTDGTNERIFFVTPGYQLIGLDAKTGAQDPAFGKNGIVDLREDDDQEIDLLNGDISLHATPLVTKNVIVVGAAHLASLQPRSRKNVKGYTRGFDVRTGKRLWIFHTIPRKGEFGYETWLTEGSAEITGNTGVWGQIAADEELGIVYVGVEMPTGDEVGIYRPGNGLFGESIVALDLKTGQRKWHFQMVHHGLWDRDVPCSAILCDVPVNGKTVRMVAQPTKQALLYVFNRETGEPVWPIPELPVPKGSVPGEWYSPTQPFPSKPPAYDLQGLTNDDLIDFTPAIKARALEIASHYQLGPAYTPAVMRKADGSTPWATLVIPGLEGGSNWPGAS